MYKPFQYIVTSLVILCGVNLVSAQEKDTIQTDVINVVKPYTPTISDAFKVKTTPTLDDSATTEKKQIDYDILSVPVASTFIPTKGKAAKIEREPLEPYYNNYISFGYGSYGNLFTELYATKEFYRIGSFGARVAFDQSKGGIEDAYLDDSFADFSGELEYINRQRDLTWSVRGGLRKKSINWYGVTDNSVSPNLDVEQNYYELYAIGDLDFHYTYIKSGSVMVRRFYDDFDSTENYLKATGQVDLPIMDEEISTNVRLDYLNGHAGTRYGTGALPEYGNILIGAAPTYELRNDDFTLNIGAAMYFMLGLNDTETSFYVYPDITASYRIVDDVVIAYAGFTGDIIQNTYRDLVDENPFVSPTLNVKPTDNNYNAYAGMLGRFTNDIGYNVKVGYTSEDDKALFRKNQESSGDSFKNGNSFTVVYDNINTLQALVELNVDMNRNLKVGLRAEYFNYNTTFQEEAWNLPNIKATVFGDYLSDQKWFAGANIFYVGERNDQLISGSGDSLTEETISLDGYIDLNLEGGYNINNRFTVSLHLNNIVGDTYEQWSGFHVQGFQLLGSAIYRFDF